MTRRATLMLVGAVAMAGCARPPAPEPIVRTVEIRVPVPVPCEVAPPRDDVDVREMVRSSDGILPRVEIVLDLLDLVTAQRDAERAALDSCRGR